MAHSILYGTKGGDSDCSPLVSRIEPVLDAFIGRFMPLTIVVTDLDKAMVNGFHPEAGKAIGHFMSSADVVGGLLTGERVLAFLGKDMLSVREEVEEIWLTALRNSSTARHDLSMSFGISTFETRDNREALIERARGGLHYSRRNGGGKAVAVLLGGHMIVSDFLGQGAPLADPVLITERAREALSHPVAQRPQLMRRRRSEETSEQKRSDPPPY